MKPHAGWTPEAVSEELAGLFADDTPSPTTSLIDAAAVLASFDPETLQPVDDGRALDEGERAAARSELERLALRSYDADGRTTWILDREARRAALRRLVADGRVRAALDANPTRRRDPVQQMLETLLLEPGVPVRPTTATDARACQVAADWVRGIVAGVPDEDVLRQAAERATQLAPFRELVGDYFAGRERELSALSDYVGVRAASSTLASLNRVVRAVFSLQAEPPLFVYGPGGIGKSTLIARFVLEHVDRPDVTQFPYAYLDFDRPGLVAEEPVTLLMEALRQLASQYPTRRGPLEALGQEWGRRIAEMASSAGLATLRESAGVEVEPGSPRQGMSSGMRAAAADVRPPRYESLWSRLRLSDRGYFLETFAHETRQLPGAESQPMLLVLDTFEEVQLRHASHEDEVFRFLDQLQSMLPFLRVVLCGRVPPARHAIRPLELATFDLESSTAFLTARVRISREGAETVARQISGSPLTLRLAVDLLRRAHDTPGGLSDLRAVLGDLRRGSVEAQLYTRVLEHITDPDVRKLAHPGLLLRRITPGIIQYVLARPCGLDVGDRATALHLLEKLRREVVLVTSRAPEVLVHRPELRAVMLGPLREDDPGRARQVNEAAVVFYESQPPDPETRAEEIYHRLLLGHDRATLDARWMDGVEHYLATAVQDLAPRAQGYLAGRMPLTLAPDVWPAVDLVDWERYATRELRELLRLGNLNAALGLLDMREQFSDPQLKVLQVELLVRTGNMVSAEQVAVETLARVPADSQEAGALRAHLASITLESDAASAGAAAQPAVVPRSGAPVPRGGSATGEASTSSIPPDVVRTLGEALADAYRDDSRLREMLERYGLGALARDEGTAGGHDSAALAATVCARAARQGLLGPLVFAARRSAPSNGRLWAVADVVGLLPRGLADMKEVQGTVLPDRRQHEVREALTRLEAQVCRIWTGGSRPVATTGFLVGTDLVLTTTTLLADQRLHARPGGGVDVRATFDAAVTDTPVAMHGRSVGMARDWIVAEGGLDLGYLLVRLAEPVGFDPGADRGRRGWMRLMASPDRERGTGVAMFRYDTRQALVFSASPAGLRGRDATGMRLQYEIDGDAGGSGSPVFDARLEVIAMHVARARGLIANLPGRRLREGVAITHLLADLEHRGIALSPADAQKP